MPTLPELFPFHFRYKVETGLDPPPNPIPVTLDPKFLKIAVPAGTSVRNCPDVPAIPNSKAEFAAD